MAEITRAYRACIKGCRAARATRTTRAEDDERLEQARRLIDDGQFSNARAVLMEVSTRRAEWNYLFGLMLLHRQEYEKAGNTGKQAAALWPVFLVGFKASVAPGSERWKAA